MNIKTRVVRDVMAKHYATLKPEQEIISAVKTLLEYHQSAAPVVDSNMQMVGLLSEADCMKETVQEGYYNEGSALVKDLMSNKVDTVSPETEIGEISEILISKKRRMMPVVEAGQLVGIVSRHDVLKALTR